LSAESVSPAGGTGVAPVAGKAGWRRLVDVPVLFVGGGLCLIAGVLLAFLVAPNDVGLGFSQKILYFHAPIAEVALLGYLVAFVAGIQYLRTHEARWDRLGMCAVRLGLVFSLLVMATGMIWGKIAWGAWWNWEPRLTTFLIACLLYAGYFVLRATVEEEERRATFAALFAMIAFIDVPITFFSTRVLPADTMLHPVVVTTQDAGMTGTMLVAFLISMLGMTLLFVALLRNDLRVERLKEELAYIKSKLGS
jgi:heme exporter protein C